MFVIALILIAVAAVAMSATYLYDTCKPAVDAYKKIIENS